MKDKEVSLEESIESELIKLKKEGLVDMWGVDEEGDLLYKITKKGKKFVKKISK